MQQHVKRLLGNEIRGTEGEMGNVADLYFDDRTWAVRYLVVDTGGWFSGTQALLSPGVVCLPEGDGMGLPTTITREQIMGGPDVSARLPLSREKEAELALYYGWEPPMPEEVPGTASQEAGPQVGGEREIREIEGEWHLRSVNELIAYTVYAEDGECGEVDDFLLKEGEWSIACLVVDTGRWLLSRNVLLSTAHIRQIIPADRAVHVDMSKESINNLPEYITVSVPTRPAP
jgi:uncharacterized protein YrrD